MNALAGRVNSHVQCVHAIGRNVFDPASLAERRSTYNCVLLIVVVLVEMPAWRRREINAAI